MWTDFNMNEYVRVKLTQDGRKLLRKQHNELWAAIDKQSPRGYQAPEYSEAEEDSEGWSRWQLWELMQQLGHACRLGGPLPFEPSMQFECRTPNVATVGEHLG